MEKNTFKRIITLTAPVLVLGILGPWLKYTRAQSQQTSTPTFELDPFWPKPLPDHWVTGNVSGVCVDAQNHVFTVNRGNLVLYEQKTAKPAPPITEFDQEGTLVNSWGNRDLLPAEEVHGCYVDYQNNIWVAGNLDGIVQKWTHDGSKMLLQIGTRGKFDSSDGTMAGAAMNSSHQYLNRPASVAVDKTNGDVYIADGYGNRRVVVFDREGHFLRQWGRQGTLAEVDSGMGGVFLSTVHCVVIGNDGLVYVCDRLGLRIEIFDKMGNFKRNIWIKSDTARATGAGSACWVGFSTDTEQKFIYVGNCGDAEIRTLDRATGEPLASFGRPGAQPGEFGTTHTLAIDLQGNLVVGDNYGRRIQMWRLIK